MAAFSGQILYLYLSIEVIRWIPHTYIILYRAIYLIPVYICITGATYIHTKNKAGDNGQQHHGSGKTNVIDIHGHSPHIGCGLSPPATPPAPKLCSAGLLGGRGRKGCMPQLLGKVGRWGQEEQGSLQPGMPVPISLHTINPCLWRNKGYSTLSISLPTSTLVPGSFPGGPHFLCQWCGAFWNV